MKKLLALVLAVVLSLGLASVAFADVYGNGQLTNVTEKDKDSTYHKLPNTFSESDTISLWACFDGEEQNGSFTFVDSANPTDKHTPAVLTKDGAPIAFLSLPINKGTAEAPAYYNEAELNAIAADFAKYVNFGVKITSNAQYVKYITVLPENVSWAENAKTATWDFYVGGLFIEVLPIDHVIAENKLVEAYLYAWNNHALAADYIWGCDIEIELRNHYIDVYCPISVTNPAPIQNNGSTFGYTGGNDLMDVYKADKNLILHRHYGQNNTSTQPSYVVYDEQFKADKTLILKATTFTYTGLVDITIADTYAQDGINFKYGEGKFAPSVAQLYANPDLAGYYFDFYSAETVESATTLVFNKANVAKYVGDTAYIYYSVDGKTYEALGTVDMKDAKATVTVNLEAGDVLGYYLFLNSALEVAEEETGKDNVGTGASDMTSVCVALAVVSLVAAGAVCVKKVSK